MSDPIVIVSAARTPIGGLLGDFANLAAWDWARWPSGRRRARRRAADAGRRGAVRQLPDGRPGPGAGAPGHASRAGLPKTHGAVTLSKMCGSRHARDDVRARHAGRRQRRRDGGRRHGEHDQRAHLLFKSAQGRQVRRTRSSSTTWRWTAWKTPTSAARHGRVGRGLRRQVPVHPRAQDQFAIASVHHAQAKLFNEDGSFDWEMAPVTLPGPQGRARGRSGRRPFKAKLDKIPTLKPAFKKDGTITAANAPASTTAPRRWC
jgi:acetyl-CoA C-acetyltransferase